MLLNNSKIKDIIKKIFINEDLYNFYYNEVFNGNKDCYLINDTKDILNIINKDKNRVEVEDGLFSYRGLFYTNYSTFITIYLIKEISKYIKPSSIFIENLFNKIKDFSPFYILNFKINDVLIGENEKEEYFKKEYISELENYLNVYFLYIDDNNFDFFLQDEYISFICNNNYNFIKISLNTIYDENFGIEYKYAINNYEKEDKDFSIIKKVINNEEYKQITIKKKNGEINLLEGDLEIIGDDTKFIELKKQYPFSKIETEIHNGKTNKFKIKEKIKLKKDDK